MRRYKALLISELPLVNQIVHSPLVTFDPCLQPSFGYASSRLRQKLFYFLARNGSDFERTTISQRKSNTTEAVANIEVDADAPREENEDQ